MATKSPEEEYFEHYHGKLLALDDVGRERVRITIDILWRAFNVAYPDIDSFREVEAEEQSFFLQKLSDTVKNITGDSTAEAAAAALIQLYLSAIAQNDLLMIDRIGDALADFSELGDSIAEQSATESQRNK